MKTFTIITEIQCTKTIGYTVEADSLEEAESKITEGELRGDGVGIISYEENNWGTEVIIESGEVSN